MLDWPPKNTQGTINGVFEDYSLFSKLSGIELNIDKTEIETEH